MRVANAVGQITIRDIIMRFSTRLVFTLGVTFSVALARGAEPETAELSFDRRFEIAATFAGVQRPAWVTGVEQQGGRFLDEPHSWQVAGTTPEGVGRLAITLDRQKVKMDLVATILFDANDASDIAVQLFDAQGRVVVVDLFGNLVDVGKEAKTDTFIIPLRKYPTAEKIVLRRIRGTVSVYGIVLYPVVGEGEPVTGELEKLARVLGDPLSPENPLLKSLQSIAKSGKVEIASIPISPSKSTASTPAPRAVYPGAVAPPAGTKAPLPPIDGLVGHWSFDQGDIADSSGQKQAGRSRGTPLFVDGIHGKAIHLRGARKEAVIVPHSAALDLKETLTVSAWIKYSSIAPTWGSQIVWHGDSQLGRDPWLIHLLPNGRLEFRSDRSITGKPVFIVFDDEIKLSPKGEPMPNQHVAVLSQKTLAPETWYFVAATAEKLSPKLQVFKLYVNGEPAGEMKTEETVNYETDRMWLTIGGVDTGNWQNFDGVIDEVRVYNRPLSLAEIQALYRQPRQ